MIINVKIMVILFVILGAYICIASNGYDSIQLNEINFYINITVCLFINRIQPAVSKRVFLGVKCKPWLRQHNIITFIACENNNQT